MKMLSSLIVFATCTACLAGNPSPGPAPSAPPTADTLPRCGEDVRYPSGEIRLAAELMLPAGRSGPVPGAVIVQGSGDSDRSNVWSRLIAAELVDAGVAVLLTDKRGTGASQGEWRSVGFDVLADDALAGVAYLASRPEVDAGRVGLVGLSQGGWVVPVAAARAPDRVGFVVNVSGAAVSFAEQTFHEMANTARQAGLDEPQVAEVVEMNRAVGEYLASGDWAAYERAREAALATPWRPIAEGFPGSPDLPVWTFLREVMGFSPTPYWSIVAQPVLVVYGEEDEHDNVPVAESVRRLEHAFAATGGTDHRIAVVPGAGHGFLQHETHGLMPEFAGTLRTWVRENVVGRAGSRVRPTAPRRSAPTGDPTAGTPLSR